MDNTTGFQARDLQWYSLTPFEALCRGFLNRQELRVRILESDELRSYRHMGDAKMEEIRLARWLLQTGDRRTGWIALHELGHLAERTTQMKEVLGYEEREEIANEFADAFLGYLCRASGWPDRGARTDGGAWFWRLAQRIDPLIPRAGDAGVLAELTQRGQQIRGAWNRLKQDEKRLDAPGPVQPAFLPAQRHFAVAPMMSRGGGYQVR